MDPTWKRADDLGPCKVLYIHEPARGLRAIVVVDNVAAGPSIGGCRMAEDVSLEECFRLARAMTFKNAAAALPHGGGKSVIFADPRMPAPAKEELLRTFAVAIRDVRDYIVGPDMGTDERCMGWIHDEIGRSVGLPPEVGGIPLDEIGATGFGLSVCAEVAEPFSKVRLSGARVAVQGFGSVGRHAARYLASKGALLVGASDSRGSVVDPAGLDVLGLIEHKKSGHSVRDFAGGQPGDREAVIDVDCDIWIPAARPDVIAKDNVDRLNTRLILEGANIPVTVEAETSLAKRGVLVVPDFICNAGGVICAAVEYAGGTKTGAFDAIDEKIRSNTRAVLERARDGAMSPRAAAMDLSMRRVRNAMRLRRGHGV